MKNITDIDLNFKIETDLNVPGIKFYNALEEPFSLHGVFMEDGRFRRLPEKTAESVNGGVHALHANTAGGRVRFKTDSPYIAIHAVMPPIYRMSHFALTGSASFDLYMKKGEEQRFVDSFKRQVEDEGGYESILHPAGSGMREYTINFPTYADVCALHIGLDEQAAVERPEAYKITKPVVYYGSSITQGACATRPGNAYQCFISRKLDCDFVNLGFSGSARGEQEMADYIAGLDMSVFVCDYDHNAPTAEHLADTHEKFVMTVRAAHPDLPIVIMGRPVYHPGSEAQTRLEILRTTYENALKRGDKNVWLLDGPTLMAMAEDDGLADSAHPNDLGFASMAKAVGQVLKSIFAS